MREITGYLAAAPAATRVHAGDHLAQRFQEGGCYPWSAPRSPEEDDCLSGMRSAREWWTCGYCGSMHPQELAAAIRLGATVSWADFKYGWPHKVYVAGAPNRYAGHGEIRSGVSYCGSPPQAEIDAGKWERYHNGFDSTTGERTYSYRTPLPAPTPAREHAHGKFYTLHLQDASTEDRAVIEAAMGLRFHFDGDTVRWERYPTGAG
jgi:hypothetical protein